MQKLEQTNKLQQKQELNLSQQQLTALKLLTAPIADLQQIINEEIQQNPVLEMNEKREVSFEETEEKMLNEISQIEENYVNEITYTSPDDEAKREHFLNSLTYNSSAIDNLNEQLLLLDIDDFTLEICKKIIEEIDSDGYLSNSENELAEQFNLPLAKIQKALGIVQSLEPHGIAVHNLKERLLLQLKLTNRKKSTAYKIIENHLEDLAANRLPLISQKLEISMEELKKAIIEIKLLQPIIELQKRDSTDFIQEEMVVKIQKGKPVVEILNDKIPQLHINTEYKNMLDDKNLSDEDKKFIKQKISSGLEFIKNLANRQSTLEKIANAIIKHQTDFFLKGEEFLKPLTMKEIAKEVEFSEATISRTANSKYLRCKFGLLPLRKFFISGGSANNQGEIDIVSDAIKIKIKSIIAEENKNKPFTDDKIGELLEKQNIKIARRTVAKYREALGIPATSKRKEY